MRQPPPRPTSEQVCDGQPGSFRAWEIRPAFFPFHWHHHRELELTLIIRGSGTRVVGDLIESFTDGDLVLLGGGLPHNWYAPGPVPGGMRAVVVQFPPELLERLAAVATEWRPLGRLAQDAATGLAMVGATRRPVAALLKMLARMPAGSATSLATLADILVRVATAPAGHRRSLGAAATGAPADDGRFAPVFALVRDRLPAAIPQRQAAALVHLSPAAFCRAFRAATGATFSAHVLGRRLTLAAEALAAGNRTVARIAADCGFAGSAHFNRRFRQRFGCTPSAYRKLVRGG